MVEIIQPKHCKYERHHVCTMSGWVIRCSLTMLHKCNRTIGYVHFYIVPIVTKRVSLYLPWDESSFNIKSVVCWMSIISDSLIHRCTPAGEGGRGLWVSERHCALEWTDQALVYTNLHSHTATLRLARESLGARELPLDPDCSSGHQKRESRADIKCVISFGQGRIVLWSVACTTCHPHLEWSPKSYGGQSGSGCMQQEGAEANTSNWSP